MEVLRGQQIKLIPNLIFYLFLRLLFLFWTFISLFAQIAMWSWIYSKFFFIIITLDYYRTSIFFYNWVKWCCKKVKVVVLFWYSFRSENNLIHYWSIKFILKIENSCFFEGPAEISYAIMKTMMLKQWIRLTFWPFRTSRLSRYIDGNWCVV